MSKKTFLYCGTSPALYKDLGNIIHFPMIRIQPIIFSEEDTRRIISQWNECHIVIFTSQFAVRYFCDVIQDYADINDFTQKVVCVVGEETRKAFHRYSGLAPTMVARVETSEGLIEDIKPHKDKIAGKNILFPRSALPNPLIKSDLTAKFGANVIELQVYDNIKPSKRALPEKPIDGIIFTSPSSVINFMKDYDSIPKEWDILVKGPVTQHRLNKFGYQGQLVQHESK